MFVALVGAMPASARQPLTTLAGAVFADEDQRASCTGTCPIGDDVELVCPSGGKVSDCILRVSVEPNVPTTYDPWANTYQRDRSRLVDRSPVETAVAEARFLEQTGNWVVASRAS